MNFFSLAINNIKRSPVRAILTAMSVLVSAATLIIVLSLDKGYSSAVSNDLRENTGIHLFVTREGCPIEAASVIAQGGLSPVYVDETLVDKIRQVPNVEDVLPFKLFAITTDDGMRTDIFMGVTESILEIRPDWKIARGGWFEEENSVILGAEVALIEQLGIGDRMYSEHFDKEFVVSGILESNLTQDDGAFFLPLQSSLELVNRKGRLSAIAIKLNDISYMDQTRSELQAMVPEEYYIVGSKELSDGILQFFGSTRVIMFVMVLVAFIIAVFGIINTMLMSVLERKKEIAYLKCVGAGRSDLIKMITIETLTICIIGSAAGTIAGTLLSPVFGNFMRQFITIFVPAGSIVQTDVRMALMAFVTCSFVGMVCAIYPALKAARIVPMEVLRNE
ncbi:ABC transporter permease [Chitinispirillales bacterium ANBcel5]|uniref:ABC transporter permease n=1 Tax=Cellulosispirillum alkaliphilum TaxID=3039283 RepID=UPI002A545DB3|nr:ABC transporter permease [Chitinispirillales bacterium ANBcel5]